MEGAAAAAEAGQARAVALRPPVARLSRNVAAFLALIWFLLSLLRPQIVQIRVLGVNKDESKSSYEEPFDHG